MSFHASPATDGIVLRPGRLAKRKLPVNFNRDDLSLFGHELERVIPETRLLKCYNVGVSAEGILFKQGKILPESFAFPANQESWKWRSVLKFLLNNYLLRRPRRFERESVWVTDDWSAGYFHWLTDVLTRLFVLGDRLEHLTLLLPGHYEALDFVNSSLKALGVKAVEFIRADEVLKCGRLFIPTHTAPSGHYNEEIIRAVRSLLLQSYGDTNYRGEGERVYISRGRARKRRVLNEDEVVEVLEEFGFRIIHAEDHSFEEQVGICSRARYLVSNHGAGLTNMLFLNEAASMLELRHQADRTNNCYFTLAAALNLKYFYQTCRSANRDQDPHLADLVVDTNVLRTTLNLMLAS